MTDEVQLFTDSSAAKSSVSRTGLGRMKHLEIRDLWRQREVGLGRVLVNKVEGTRNPVDLMTKNLKRWEIEVRLRLMGIRNKWKEECQEEDEEMLTKEVNTLGFSLFRRGPEHYYHNICLIRGVNVNAPFSR